MLIWCHSIPNPVTTPLKLTGYRIFVGNDVGVMRCYLGECDACPGIEELKQELLTQFDENDMDQIVYKQWVSTDRSTLETYLSQAEEFADTFCDKLELLRPHSFIAKEQASFYATRKTTLKAGEFLVTADFSENYSFLLQDSAQGFHWNNSQATLHPFVAYYLDSTEVPPFELCSYIGLSAPRHCSYPSFPKTLHRFFEEFFAFNVAPKENNILF